MNPIDDDPDLAFAMRFERLGVLIDYLTDLQFAEKADPKKIQSIVLFLDQEYRDCREEQHYLKEARDA